MKPIKLTDISCGGRIDGMGKRHTEGSYIEITCTDRGDPGDAPQTLTFSVSEGMAEALVAEIKGALMRAFDNSI